MFLTSAGFLGTLYLIPLYFQDARGLSALQSGLSTFPEAFGVMAGAQIASRLVYPRLGPRRHITVGLVGLTVMMLVLTQIGLTTSLWLIRGIMFLLGLMMAQIFVPTQAASFAKISPASTGRASTLFNTGRQVGSAVGVAVLSTVLIGVGATHSVAGVVHPDLRALPPGLRRRRGLRPGRDRRSPCPSTTSMPPRPWSAAARPRCAGPTGTAAVSQTVA